MDETSISSADASSFQPTTVDKNIEPLIDAGNLLIEDLEPLESKKPTDAELKALARDDIQLLINEIWKLPTERVDEVIVAKLPQPTTRLCREKPLPTVRPMTKWQEYAKAKGIHKTNTKKDSNKTWDDVNQRWTPNWGYQRARADREANWVVEVPTGDDPYKDYLAAQADAKKERTAKNQLQRLKNEARARKTGPLADPAPGLGLTAQGKSAQQVSHQLYQAKASTASVGKFESTLPNEKPPKKKGKHHTFAPNESSVDDEKRKQLELLGKLSKGAPKIHVDKAIASEVNRPSANDKNDAGGGSESDRKRKRKITGKGRADVKRQKFWSEKSGKKTAGKSAAGDAKKPASAKKGAKRGGSGKAFGKSKVHKAGKGKKR